MGAGRSPGSTDATGSVESVDQMDAMDRMDDDGSPDSEEMHDAAAEQVEQAGIAEAITPRPRRNGHPSIQRLSSRHTSTSRRWNTSHRRPHAPPSAESAPVAAAETATAPPPTPDPADHDPQ
jgi:hypothetical protein